MVPYIYKKNYCFLLWVCALYLMTARLYSTKMYAPAAQMSLWNLPTLWTSLWWRVFLWPCLQTKVSCCLIYQNLIHCVEPESIYQSLTENVVSSFFFLLKILYLGVMVPYLRLTQSSLWNQRKRSTITRVNQQLEFRVLLVQSLFGGLALVNTLQQREWLRFLKN